MPLSSLSQKLDQLLGQWNFTKNEIKMSQAQINEVASFIRAVTNIFLEDRNVEEAVKFLKQGKVVTLGVLASICPDNTAIQNFLQLLKILHANGATPTQIIDILQQGSYTSVGERKTVGAQLVHVNQKMAIEYLNLLTRFLNADKSIAKDVLQLLLPNRDRYAKLSLIAVLLGDNKESEPLETAINFLKKLHDCDVKKEDIQKLTWMVPKYAPNLYYYFKAHPAVFVEFLTEELIHPIFFDYLKGLKNSVIDYDKTLAFDEQIKRAFIVKTPDSQLHKFFMQQRGLRVPNPESRKRGSFAFYNNIFDKWKAEQDKDDYKVAIVKEQSALAAAIKESLSVTTEAGGTAQTPAAHVEVSIKKEISQGAVYIDPEIPPQFARTGYLHALANCGDASHLYTSIAVPMAIDTTQVPPPYNPEVVNPNAIYPIRIAPGEYKVPEVLDKTAESLLYLIPTAEIVDPQITVPAAATAQTASVDTKLYGTEVEKEVDWKLLQWKAEAVTATPGTLYYQSNQAEKSEQKPKAENASKRLTG